MTRARLDVPESAGTGAKEDATGRGLSVGDAVTIVALLAFALGWMVLMTMTGNDDEPPYSDADRVAAVIYLAVILIPPVWAGGLVRKIVERSL